MSKTLLVSLVSDQTIPNVQLINEYGRQIDQFLFISTQAMEKKGVRQWIVNACHLPGESLLPAVVVDQFSFDDIELQLDRIDFEAYGRIIVNLTGGTKVMTLAAFDFFKDLGAEIFYITGSDDRLIKLAPGRKKKTEVLASRVGLTQYLQAYGFMLKETEPSPIGFEYTSRFFGMFARGIPASFPEVMEYLRTRRSFETTDISAFETLPDFLREIEFPKTSGILLKSEVKYLTGEWFEEYVAAKIKQELNLEEDQLKTGLVITKKNREGVNIQNELDVVFIWENRIYTIECKTSVFNPVVLPDGEIKTTSIMGETLYKVESLKQGFGLFANASLIMLDSLKANGNRLKNHLDRAALYGIRVIDRDALEASDDISLLTGIKVS